MIVDIFSRELYSWWSEHCLLCGSKNYIQLIDSNADAYECWNCKSRWWIDSMALTAYMIVHSKTEEESEEDLRNGNSPIIILDGNMTRG